MYSYQEKTLGFDGTKKSAKKKSSKHNISAFSETQLYLLSTFATKNSAEKFKTQYLSIF